MPGGRKCKIRRIDYNKPLRYKTIQPNGACRPHVIKDPKQVFELATEWAISHHFDTARIRAIAKRLGMTHRKVYKWVWDRKKEQESL